MKKRRRLNLRRRLLSGLLTLAMVFTMLPGLMAAETEEASAAWSFYGVDESDLFVAQSGKGRCTIASAVMMFRMGALINGDANWVEFTESNYLSSWWAGGLNSTLSGHGMVANRTRLVDYYRGDAAVRKQYFINQLEKHKEGVMIFFSRDWYTTDVDHAVLLTDYDAASDQFWCADPSGNYAYKRIKLQDSLLGPYLNNSGLRNSSLPVQDNILAYVWSIWTIDSGIAYCNHTSDFKTTGYCTLCKAHANYTELSVDTGYYYETVDNDPPIRELPYKAAGRVGNICYNKNVGGFIVERAILNGATTAGDHTWYYVTTPSGVRGWVAAGHMKKTNKKVSASISYTPQTVTPPLIVKDEGTTHTVGVNFTGNKSTIQTVSGSFYNSAGTLVKTTPIYAVNSGTYSTAGKGIDVNKDGLILRYLDPGTYYYTVQANGTNGASATFRSQNFTVVQSRASGIPAPQEPYIEIVKQEVGKKTVRIYNPTSGAKLTYCVSTAPTTNIESTASYVDIEVRQPVSISAYASNSGGTSYMGGKAGRGYSVDVPELAWPSIYAAQTADAANITISGPEGAALYYSYDNNSWQRYYGAVTAYQSGTIYAKAEKAGCITSYSSEEFTLTAPSTPEISLNNTDPDIAVGEPATITWKEDPLAQYYTVAIFKNSERYRTVSNYTDTQYALNLDGEAGTYTFTVSASNNFGTTSGENSVSVRTHDPLTVRFLDYDGSELSVQKVRYGYDANQPEATAQRRGYTFNGWAGSFYGIKKDTDVTARYTINSYTIKYYDTDGKLLDTRSVDFGNSAEEVAPSVTTKKDGYKFEGWAIRKASDDSERNIEEVDSDMELIAVTSWGSKTLPQLMSDLKIEAATGSSKAGETVEYGYDVSFKLSTSPEIPDERARIIVSLLSNDNRMLAVNTQTVYQLRDAQLEEHKIFVSCNEVAARAEVNILALDGNDRTGGMIGQSLSGEVDNSGKKQWSEWTSDKSAIPAGAETEESKEYKYRYNTKVTYKSLSATPLEGYSLESTDGNGEYGDWSAWSTTKPADVSGREIESRQVKTGSHTEYKYYSYVGTKSDGTTHQNYCPYDAYVRVGVRTTKRETPWLTTPLTKVDWWSHRAYPGHNSATYQQQGIPLCEAPYLAGPDTMLGTYIYNGQEYYWYDTRSVNDYQTQYRYRDKNAAVYTYYRWVEGDTSDWTMGEVDNPGDGSVTIAAERSVYRYVVSDESKKEYADFTEHKLDIGDVLGDAADELFVTILVYKAQNSDPTESQLEFVGQTTKAGLDTYSFKTKEEPTAETGDFVVALAPEGFDGLISIGSRIEASEKVKYTVSFRVAEDIDGNGEISQEEILILDTQQVEEGGTANLPTAPEKAGYTFVGWDRSISDVRSNLSVEAVYVPNMYTVVFVDYMNQNCMLEKYEGGQNLRDPYYDGEKTEYPSCEGYSFEGFGSEIGTAVTEDMVVELRWSALEYNVNFRNADGSVLETEAVKYGKAATPPAASRVKTEEGTVFLAWSEDSEWWNVKRDMDIYPIIVYEETTASPLANMGEYERGISKELELTAEDNATIYYTIDGSVPDPEQAVSQDDDESGAEGESKTYVYTEPLGLDETTYIRAVAAADGKNVSDVVEIYFVYDENAEREELMEGLADIGTYSVLAKPGESVTLNFNIENNPGIAAYLFTVDADPSVFGIDYDEEDYEAKLTDGELCRSKGFSFVGNYTDGMGWQLMWFGSQATEGDGKLLSLDLRVSEEAEEGYYPIKVSYSPANTVTNDDIAAEVDSLNISIGAASLLGDINGDGMITTIDVVRIARSIIGDLGLTIPQQKAADVNSDGEVNAKDVIRLARYIIGLSSLG